MLEKLSNIRFKLIELSFENIKYNYKTIQTFINQIRSNDTNFQFEYSKYYINLLKKIQDNLYLPCETFNNEINLLPHNQSFEDKLYKLYLQHNLINKDGTKNENISYIYDFKYLFELLKKNYKYNNISIRSIFKEYIRKYKNFNNINDEANTFKILIENLAFHFSWKLSKSENLLFINNFDENIINDLIYELQNKFASINYHNILLYFNKTTKNMFLVISMDNDVKIVNGKISRLPSVYNYYNFNLKTFEINKETYDSKNIKLNSKYNNRNKNNSYDYEPNNYSHNYSFGYNNKKKEKVKSDAYVNVNNKEKYISQYEDGFFEDDDGDWNIYDRYNNRVDYVNGYVRSKEDGWYYSDDDDSYNY